MQITIKLMIEIEEQEDTEIPLINKLKTIKNDMNKFKKKINEKEEKLSKLKRISKYYDGELEGADKMKAEREILLENQKEVDNQGLMINSIQEDIKAVGTNLNNINTELDSQGQKMNRIQDKVNDTENEIKKTSRIMGKLERRHNCMKILSLIFIIIFGILDLVWLIFLFIYRFWKN